jgi:hypothetical protein
MKTNFTMAGGAPKTQGGFAVMIILILLTIMVVLAAANTATVNRLRQRVKIVEQRQTRRLASFSTNSWRAGSVTNQPAAK